MENLPIVILFSFIIATGLRLWGNFSIQLLLGINPRNLAVKKRLIHWIFSYVAAILIIKVLEKISF